jgi:DNA-binding CsgD family transcriptional regulator
MEAAASCMTMSGPLRNLGWMDRALEILGPQAKADRTPVELAWGCIAAMTGNLDGANMALTAFADGRFDATLAKAPSALVTWLAFCAMWVGQMTERFDVAEHTFDKTWELAQFLGSPLSITMLGQGRASVLCRRGRLAEAGEIVTAMNNANAGLVGGLAATVAMPNAFLALESGDPKGAYLACVQLESQFLEGRSSTYPVVWIWLWKVRAELALDVGRVHDAADLSISIRDLAAASKIVEPCSVPWADTAMAAFLRAGRYGDAESLIEHLEAVSSGWPCAWPRSVAESGRAGLAEVAGDEAAADRHYRRAIELLEEVELPLARARALIDHGTFLRRIVQPARARDPLARAAEVAGACGALRLEGLALTELRACGGRRRRSTTELSPQEQRVAHLAAQGATNAQIAAALVISVKTVEHHLSTAYTKLGIHSRLELAAHLRPDPT